eukprot:TRINITY_DN16812_c0_g1_i3.p1 TRINITY_DN16812_c0_g1~~TRINITY_DN16812_c0_g1_i3.p1  ORF type:complete len:353 (-),score=59.28 TRINITY_DN16812_c0_g1_i3:148-1155(-)
MDALGLLSDDDGDASDDAKEEEQDTTACEHDAKRQKVGIVDFAALQRAGYSEGADEGEEQAASDSFKKTFSALQDAVKDDLPGRQKLGTEVPGLETTYEIMTEGDPVRTVAKGCKVIVHATGVIKKTGRVFWSTKEVDKGFSYKTPRTRLPTCLAESGSFSKTCGAGETKLGLGNSGSSPALMRRRASSLPCWGRQEDRWLGAWLLRHEGWRNTQAAYSRSRRLWSCWAIILGYTAARSPRIHNRGAGHRGCRLRRRDEDAMCNLREETCPSAAATAFRTARAVRCAHICLGAPPLRLRKTCAVRRDHQAVSASLLARHGTAQGVLRNSVKSSSR